MVQVARAECDVTGKGWRTEDGGQRAEGPGRRRGQDGGREPTAELAEPEIEARDEFAHVRRLRHLCAVSTFGPSVPVNASPYHCPTLLPACCSLVSFPQDPSPLGSFAAPHHPAAHHPSAHLHGSSRSPNEPRSSLGMPSHHRIPMPFLTLQHPHSGSCSHCPADEQTRPLSSQCHIPTVPRIAITPPTVLTG